MPITTLSSREFNQDTSRAKKAAKRGPVFITDRGRPAHVLLTIEEYRKLVGANASIVDMLAICGAADTEFEPPRLRGPLARRMYALDTNVVSGLRRAMSGKANPQLTEWASGVAASSLFLSAITAQSVGASPSADHPCWHQRRQASHEIGFEAHGEASLHSSDI